MACGSPALLTATGGMGVAAAAGVLGPPKPALVPGNGAAAAAGAGACRGVERDVERPAAPALCTWPRLPPRAPSRGAAGLLAARAGGGGGGGCAGMLRAWPLPALLDDVLRPAPPLPLPRAVGRL